MLTSSYAPSKRPEAFKLICELLCAERQFQVSFDADGWCKIVRPGVSEPVSPEPTTEGT